MLVLFASSNKNEIQIYSAMLGPNCLLSTVGKRYVVSEEMFRAKHNSL